MPGILFKFVYDHKGAYRSDRLAAKEAGHQLKSLVRFRQSGTGIRCVRACVRACARPPTPHKRVSGTPLPVVAVGYSNARRRCNVGGWVGGGGCIEVGAAVVFVVFHAAERR